MATEDIGGGEALLALARKLRHAISARQDMVRETLDAYDSAVGERFYDAANFVHVLQHADVTYESSLREALERFREAIEESEWR